MNLLNHFEMLCYALSIMCLAELIILRKKEDLLLFVSASLAGFALELLAVRLTGIYHYSTKFIFNIGTEPYQFPLFGGFMWGGLTVYALRAAEKFRLSPIMTSLLCGWLIVTMDLFLDVAAIRLNGGFWIWEGRPVNLDITHHMFMSVLWVNFLGYLFETPAMVFLFLKTRNVRKDAPVWKNLLYVLGFAAAGVAFVGAASGISLFLNSLTDEWFACIAFTGLWSCIFILLLRHLKTSDSRMRSFDLPLFLYWSAMYLFCIASLAYLGIVSKMPLYFICCLAASVFTLWLSVHETE